MFNFKDQHRSVASFSGAAVAFAAIALGGTQTAAAASPTDLVVNGSASVGSLVTDLDAAQAEQETGAAEAARVAAEAEFNAAVAKSMIEKAEAEAAAWHNPVSSYYMSSYYGEMRSDGPHNAIDLAGPEGQDVRAGRSGTVISAGWQSGYGFTVEIDHGDGHTSLYAHLMSEPYVAVGQSVAGGQPIGALGNTGYSTGPHLHLEVERNGVLISPLEVMPIPESA